MTEKLTYKDAGVDTKEGERAVKLMKDHVKKTFNENVLTDIGGFGGLFRLPAEGMKEPVLVSGTDGVGTKLKLAFIVINVVVDLIEPFIVFFDGILKTLLERINSPLGIFFLYTVWIDWE